MAPFDQSPLLPSSSFPFPPAGVYDEMKQHSTAQRLLHEAKALSGDVARQCMISATIAEMFDKMVSISIALTRDDPTSPDLILSDLI
jgi:hypothetical protein